MISAAIYNASLRSKKLIDESRFIPRYLDQLADAVLAGVDVFMCDIRLIYAV